MPLTPDLDYMTHAEGMDELRRLYHTTRYTQDIHVPAYVIAAVLGYNETGIRTMEKRHEWDG